jgi:hypothetical protein
MMSTPAHGRTTTHTVLLVLGSLILLAGLVCVVIGFVQFADADPAGDDSTPMALFAGGGLAAVVGLGIVAFTRANAMTRGGAYSRVTIEQGVRGAGGRFCPSCGHPAGTTARFCDSCGTALG